jgi:L-fucose mutarotase
MLKNIDPLLTADLLHALRAMGHGDEIAIVDANFPARKHARRFIEIAGASATEVLDVILSVLPLDTYVDHPAHGMQIVNEPDKMPVICQEFADIINRREKREMSVQGLERDMFYKRTADCFAVVSTAETRLYGNIILTKGVVEHFSKAP